MGGGGEGGRLGFLLARRGDRTIRGALRERDKAHALPTLPGGGRGGEVGREGGETKKRERRDAPPPAPERGGGKSRGGESGGGPPGSLLPLFGGKEPLRVPRDPSKTKRKRMGRSDDILRTGTSETVCRRHGDRQPQVYRPGLFGNAGKGSPCPCAVCDIRLRGPL